MHKSRLILLASSIVLLPMLGCGQKGPLYRSDGRAQEVTRPESGESARKKSRPTFPAPQSQKEDRESPPTSDPTPTPPANDSDRSSAPTPPSN